MGCGKTTVGKALAAKLGCEFADLDELIVQTEGRTIPQIFSQSGEEYFRNVETRLICSFDRPAVVALGGGAVMKKENTEAMSRLGVLIFIDTDFDVCCSRICGDANRPLAATADRSELLQRYESRLPIYKAASDVTVSGIGSPEDIAADIMKLI